MNKTGTLGPKCLPEDRSVAHSPPHSDHPKGSLHCLCRDVCEIQRGSHPKIFSKEFGSGNTAACRTFCSCWKHIHENVKARTRSLLLRRRRGVVLTCCWGNSFGWFWLWTLLLLSHSSEGWTCLWLKTTTTKMLLFRPALLDFLATWGQQAYKCCSFLLLFFQVKSSLHVWHFLFLLDLLEEFYGLSSEAWQSSIQHEGDERNHCIHVGSDNRVTQH